MKRCPFQWFFNQSYRKKRSAGCRIYVEISEVPAVHLRGGIPSNKPTKFGCGLGFVVTSLKYSESCVSPVSSIDHFEYVNCAKSYKVAFRLKAASNPVSNFNMHFIGFENSWRQRRHLCHNKNIYQFKKNAFQVMKINWGHGTRCGCLQRFVTLPNNCCSRRYIENDKRKEEEDKRCKDCKNKFEIEMKDRISKRIKLKIRRTKSSRSERQAIIRREEIREAKEKQNKSNTHTHYCRSI